jgi:hypothetical protein
MTSYYVEVAIPESGNGKSKLLGVHSVSGGQEVITPLLGGNSCIPVTEVAYSLLRATNGNISLIIETALGLQEWLDWEEK